VLAVDEDHSGTRKQLVAGPRPGLAVQLRLALLPEEKVEQRRGQRDEGRLAGRKGEGSGGEVGEVQSRGLGLGQNGEAEVQQRGAVGEGSSSSVARAVVRTA